MTDRSDADDEPTDQPTDDIMDVMAGGGSGPTAPTGGGDPDLPPPYPGWKPVRRVSANHPGGRDAEVWKTEAPARFYIVRVPSIGVEFYTGSGSKCREVAKVIAEQFAEGTLGVRPAGRPDADLEAEPGNLAAADLLRGALEHLMGAEGGEPGDTDGHRKAWEHAEAAILHATGATV